jgi:Zn-dependent peptidase ImmA (M78 family)
MLKRGFKAWAEQAAVGIRRELGVDLDAKLPPADLATYLEVRLWTPADIPGLPQEVLSTLLEDDPQGWSAVTQTIDDLVTVIYNPRHSSGRRASNIVHELSHVLLDHEPSKLILSADGTLVLRTFDTSQEDEASWLSGCLLLPRESLLRAARRKAMPEEIAEQFGVSEALTKYRIQITGVARQIGRRRPQRNPSA